MKNAARTFAAAAFAVTALAACETIDQPQPEPPGAPSRCAVVENRSWSAWVNAMPGPGASASLHVVGEIVLPTPGYTATLTAGAADRSATPIQQMILDLAPPTGPVAQVLTPATVRYQGPAISMQYRGVRVMCAGEVLADIKDVVVAR